VYLPHHPPSSNTFLKKSVTAIKAYSSTSDTKTFSENAFILFAKSFKLILNHSMRISMKGVARASVTFPPDLLKEFDDIIKKMGYANRSKAVQDAISHFVSERKWLQEDDDSPQTGILLMVYDHEARGLETELTEVQHHHSTLISSTLHIHIGERDCLEAIAVKGKASEIRKLSDELATKRGVKILKPMIVTL
jgi:CopG family nickel-responsive transcriptional regulator